jgi:4-alpha-glucanotransferase
MRLPRRSGILLHPTSLPGPHGSGDLGASAYHFVDWLLNAGQSLWQILPLGGIGPGNSPYMSSSAFAGNPLLINLVELHQRGWLASEDLVPDPSFAEEHLYFEAVIPWRMARLEKAASRFAQIASSDERDGIAAFQRAHAAWLDDYALFMTLADAYDQLDWCDWPVALAQREPRALDAARQQYLSQIGFWTFCQWCFFRQWHALKDYANTRGVQIVGDLPIFIALQSAEVWARQELFELNSQGRALAVSGVPPDFFSASGQRWGNPLYRWSTHAEEGYAWWVERMRHIFEFVDIVRVDHFRGFADYWEIPTAASTAVNGRWMPGPGSSIFSAMHSALGPLAIIAEDLGVITPSVDALRRKFDFPGMRILQFAFGQGGTGDSQNAYLPHNYDANTVVYTGTHDNDTVQGWWATANKAYRQHVRDYLALKPEDEAQIHWALIRAACASVADTAIHPLQDVLGLDTRSRMNLPGSTEGHWAWRFSWSQVDPSLSHRLSHLCRLYRR